MVTEWTYEFKNPVTYMAQETGDEILQENDSLIALEQTGASNSDWTYQTKN